MKLPDLMLHDWAFDDIRKEPWQMEVSDFRRLYRQGSPPDDERFNEDGTFKHLHPLPLTEEFFRKNRFGCHSMSEDRMFLGFSFRGLRNPIIWSVEKGYAFEGNIILRTVNQLQQYLRLCGLRELADNLKVE